MDRRIVIDVIESVAVYLQYGVYTAMDGAVQVARSTDLAEVFADVRFYLFSDNPDFN